MISSSGTRWTVQAWTLADSYNFIGTFARQCSCSNHQKSGGKARQCGRRCFHDYFVTHLPRSSLHPDSRSAIPSFHKLPRSESTPHTTTGQQSPATIQVPTGVTRETTVVRIPLRSAKHHFGASFSRGSRAYNEDAFQAGVIEIPAFAKRPPPSLTITEAASSQESVGAENSSGDPQVFYFGVFDGHGGSECSEFLRDSLHEYIQDTTKDFEIQSSLRKPSQSKGPTNSEKDPYVRGSNRPDDLPILQQANRSKIVELEKKLVHDWKCLVGGYFRRFKPAHFQLPDKTDRGTIRNSKRESIEGAMMEEVVEYAFLRADLDFVSAQASKRADEDDDVAADQPLNRNDVLGRPSRLLNAMIGGTKRFIGGSTCSVALISTPTPTPFWHPGTPASLLVAHVGDTRILLCNTSTGAAIPLTANHHPSSPVEASRLRRFAASFVTDSFGEERMSGLANTRAFGDIHSKRIGVSAEPEFRRVEMGASEYSFLVLMSDGISGVLPDQEIVDIVKEARTPDQAAKDVVSFATEISKDADNATCIVVRLGGWARRQEGGVGSMGTKESRDWRRQEATDPRRSRT